MFAKNLETLLSELCQKSDVSRSHRHEFAERFDALRRNGQLPRGRENRAKLLTNSQIAAEIFGLASTKTGWAGHAAIILSKLRPVGGPTASFYGTVSLLKAVECLLSDAKTRGSFIKLCVSTSESGINSHGFATLSYENDGVGCQSFFVPQEAVSLLQPGAECDFDAEKRYSAVSKDTTFNREFFDRIAKEIERAKVFPAAPEGDGSEYDAEEAKEERYRNLGVQTGSRYLNVGVDNLVTWPKHETLVTFDRFQFVLMPKSRDHVQSIHVDLTANRLTDLEAITVINQFLSVMTWCDDQYAVMQDGWSGNPVPVPVSKRDLAFTTAHHWVFDRQIPSSDKARHALALYREARNAQQNFLVSYAVLNYYKIIEIGYPAKNKKDKKNATRWIARTFPVIIKNKTYSDIIARFLEACGDESPENYIWKACRVAVAHTRTQRPSDPDHAEEIRRLHTAADVMRLLARQFIKGELRVSDCIYSGE